ncbi:MAG: hypothetical protein AMJ89_02055 [candidate division Zixibacteria bacterium SM23_73]|nr:MAG: hypothetical protein AMJ89_02055 [candidate division Zixibacteria bacterium SM23_73]
MSITKNSSAKIGIEVPEKLNLPPLTGKSPFPIRSSQGRKYVRIEITSPVNFRLLLPKREKIRLSKDQCSGRILNLSCGGILLESGVAIREGTFLLLSLNLNGIVVLEGILGRTKRVEPTEDGEYLVGVEFCLREELENFASKEQIEKLPLKVASFNHRLREIIQSYVNAARLATQETKTVF